MDEWLRSTAGHGSLVLAVPIAIVAGLVSFFSPCVIPLLPAYMSYTTGLSGADLAAGNVRRGRMLLGALLFVLGFSVVFVLLGVLSGSLGVWTGSHLDLVQKVLGVLCILFGLTFLGVVPFLQRDVRFHSIPSVGLVAAPALGALFAIGWTPCSGPTLGTIVGLAYSSGTATRGGVLLAFYSLGLGVPFLVVALAWRRALGAIKVIRRHQKWITRLGGVMFVLIGVALLTGWWDYAVQWLQIQLVETRSVSV